MGSLVAEIAERVASSSAGARSEMEIRGGAASPGTLLLSTAETSVVDGNKLGQIDFQAPVDAAGTDVEYVTADVSFRYDLYEVQNLLNNEESYLGAPVNRNA